MARKHLVLLLKVHARPHVLCPRGWQGVVHDALGAVGEKSAALDLVHDVQTVELLDDGACLCALTRHSAGQALVGGKNPGGTAVVRHEHRVAHEGADVARCVKPTAPRHSTPLSRHAVIHTVRRVVPARDGVLGEVWTTIVL